MSDHDSYNVNFFKPKSEHARSNRNLIATLAIIWAVAVFGFHFLMMFLNTPTPEKTLTYFNAVWPQVQADSTATVENRQTFARSLLMVLGKNIAVKEDHKKVLKEALSWTVFHLQTDSMQAMFLADPDAAAIQQAALSIGLEDEGFDKLMKDLLPTSLVKVENTTLSATTRADLPGIMSLYLVHNQNVFTDTQFLGFPFHYWYTAQFLLILFVVLCLIYAVMLDKINVKYKIEEGT
jgi:putative solute:sodium symporter small subunit